MNANEFQQNFMRTAKNTYHLNATLVEDYKGTVRQEIKILERGIAEIQFAEARIEELKSRKRLGLFFEDLKQKYKSNLKKATVDFTNEAAEAYRSLDKKLKAEFAEAGVSQKDLYHCIDENSEAEISAFLAKAESIDVDTARIDALEADIADKSEMIIKSANRKLKFKGIYLPIIIVLVIIGAIVAAGFFTMNAAKEEVKGIDINGISADQIIDAGMKIAEATGKTGKAAGGAAVGGVSVLVIIVVALCIIAVWLVYYKILARKIHKQMLVDLNKAMTELCARFSSNKQELELAYNERLTLHLNDINTKYFSKYQPLISQVMGGEGR